MDFSVPVLILILGSKRKYTIDISAYVLIYIKYIHCKNIVWVSNVAIQHLKHVRTPIPRNDQLWRGFNSAENSS